MSAPLAIALDHSGPGLGVAVAEADSGRLLLAEVVPGGGREAAAVLPRLNALLATHGCEFRHCRDWTVGTGPGGLTGLRAMAAWVAGLTLGQDGVRVRGIPSALVLAVAAARPDTTEVTTLYPQRDGPPVSFRAVRQARGWRLDGPATAADAPGSRSRCLTALAIHREALSGWFPEGDGAIAFQEAVPPAWLLQEDLGEWRRETLFEIIYLRPAALLPAGISAAGNLPGSR